VLFVAMQCRSANACLLRHRGGVGGCDGCSHQSRRKTSPDEFFFVAGVLAGTPCIQSLKTITQLTKESTQPGQPVRL
jgi:hypothetical protein